MTWLDDWDEAGRRRAERLAGRPPVRRVPPPEVNRSVHMRPAETPHPAPGLRDTMIGRSLAWLLARIL